MLLIIILENPQCAPARLPFSYFKKRVTIMVIDYGYRQGEEKSTKRGEMHGVQVD